MKKKKTNKKKHQIQKQMMNEWMICTSVTKPSWVQNTTTETVSLIRVGCVLLFSSFFHSFQESMSVCAWEGGESHQMQPKFTTKARTPYLLLFNVLAKVKVGLLFQFFLLFHLLSLRGFCYGKCGRVRSREVEWHVTCNTIHLHSLRVAPPLLSYVSSCFHSKWSLLLHCTVLAC